MVGVAGGCLSNPGNRGAWVSEALVDLLGKVEGQEPEIIDQDCEVIEALPRATKFKAYDPKTDFPF